HSFQVILRAYPFANGTSGFRAISGIKMHNRKALPVGDCRSGFYCRNRVCINRLAICDGEDTCGDGSDEDAAQCGSSQRLTNFDSGIGSWGYNINNGWRATKDSSSQDLRKAPTFDHSTGGTDAKSSWFNQWTDDVIFGQVSPVAPIYSS